MTDNKDHIHFIITGGTIDGKYHPPLEKKITRKETRIPNYIDNVIAPHFPCSYETIMMIDSLEMTKEHRQKIFEAVEKSNIEQIVITHGTSSMIETAQFIEQKIPNINKTIVLVGAMTPLEGIYPSDAAFNLGYAVAQVQERKHGVYISMNGYCFTSDQTVKNTDIARFEFKDS